MEEADKHCEKDFLQEQSSLLSFKIQQLASKISLISQKNNQSFIANKTSTLPLPVHQNKLLANNTLVDDEIVILLTRPSLCLPYNIGTHQEHFNQNQVPSKTKYRTHTSYSHQNSNKKLHQPIRNSRFMKKNERKYTWVQNHNLIDCEGGSYRLGKLARPKETYSSAIQDQKRKLKFLRKAHNINNRHSQIYQHKILSIDDISGQGAILFADGTTMDGNWLYGTAVGLIKVRYPDQSQYEGEITGFEPHGFGVLTDQKGMRYAGQFCFGQPHGEGLISTNMGNKSSMGCGKEEHFVAETSTFYQNGPYLHDRAHFFIYPKECYISNQYY